MGGQPQPRITFSVPLSQDAELAYLQAGAALPSRLALEASPTLAAPRTVLQDLRLACTWRLDCKLDGTGRACPAPPPRPAGEGSA